MPFLNYGAGNTGVALFGVGLMAWKTHLKAEPGSKFVTVRK